MGKAGATWLRDFVLETAAELARGQSIPEATLGLWPIVRSLRHVAQVKVAPALSYERRNVSAMDQCQSAEEEGCVDGQIMQID